MVGRDRRRHAGHRGVSLQGAHVAHHPMVFAAGTKEPASCWTPPGTTSTSPATTGRTAARRRASGSCSTQPGTMSAAPATPRPTAGRSEVQVSFSTRAVVIERVHPTAHRPRAPRRSRRPRRLPRRSRGLLGLQRRAEGRRAGRRLNRSATAGDFPALRAPRVLAGTRRAPRPTPATPALPAGPGTKPAPRRPRRARAPGRLVAGMAPSG